MTLPVVVCPHCRTELDLDAEDVGRLVECPACDKQFTADPPHDPEPPAEDEPPWRKAGGPPPRTSRYDDHRRGQYDDYTDPVRRRRQWPYRDHDDSPAALIRYAQDECNGPASGLMVVGMLTLLAGVGRLILSFTGVNNAGDPTYFLIGFSVYSVVVGAFWVYAGLQMKEAKQYGLCLVACVMVLIPGVSPCCVIGLFFGIAGVNKLNDPRVKRGFAANRPGYDPDTPA